MFRCSLLILATLATACSTVGPHRASLPESIRAVTAPGPEAPSGSEHARVGVSTEEASAPEVETPSSATPFSAGFMLGVGMALDGSGRVLPVQLAAGSCKVAAVSGRAINVLALGGLTGSSIQQAQPAWGVGASFELTPGTLAYEASVGVGALWLKGETAPAAIAGFTLTPKM